MAAPVVAGAVADLLQARPGLTPNQVKAIVLATARTVKNGANEVSAMNMERYTGTPAAANQGLTPNTLVERLHRRDRLHALELEPVELVRRRGDAALELVALFLELQLLQDEHGLDRPDAVELEPQLLVLDHGLEEVARNRSAFA